MKNIKIIVLTVIISVSLTIGGSVFGALLLNVGGQNSQLITTEKKLSANEQLNLGHKYNIYTGEKLVEQVSATEARFRAIEKRLDKLEVKN